MVDMTKTEMKKIAKEVLMASITSASYRLDSMDLSEEDAEEICKYIFKYGSSMAKTIGEKYYMG